MKEASAVVIATAPPEARKLVDGQTDAWQRLRDAIEALVPVEVACLDIGLSRLPVRDHPLVQDLGRPLFLSTQSLYACLAPEGEAMVRTFKQLDPRSPHAPRADELDLEALLDAAQSGWRESVVKRVYLPHIAAVGALPLAKLGGFDGRPEAQVPGLSSLYLVGDWVGRRGFLADASFASARTAAELILSQQSPRRQDAARPATAR